jgi:hypothetical protein
MSREQAVNAALNREGRVGCAGRAGIPASRFNNNKSVQQKRK